MSVIKRKIGLFLLLSACVFLPEVLFSAELPVEIGRNAALADRQRFPDADTVLLFDDETVRYDENGMSESVDRYAYKVLTERGRRSLRSLPLRYNRHYQEVVLRRLSIFRNGAEIALDPAAHSRDESDSSDLKMNICDPDDRILHVSLPDLEENDIILIEHVIRDRHTRMPGAWTAIKLLQSEEPIIEYRYTVDAPKKLPPCAIVLRDEIPGSVTHSVRTADDRIIHCWVAKDVPRFFPESNMAGKPWQHCQRLHLSTVRSWAEVSRWYDALCRPHLEKSGAELKNKALTLCRDTATPEEKVDALFRFVSQEIRYMGLTAETEAPGYEPHDVEQTFSQRAGVCRDKAALLVAMLDAVGLKAHMVLIMAGALKDPEIPDPAFNHAIVAWENEPGKYILMDPTAENSREKLPVFDADSSYLVATPRGETLLRSGVPDPEDNRFSIKTTGVFDEKGKFSGHTVIRPTGIFETIYRDFLQGRSPDEQKVRLSSIIDFGALKFRLDDFAVTPQNLSDTSRPLEIAFDFSFDDALPESNGAEVLQMPRFAESLALRNVFSGVTDLARRRYPQRLEATCLIEESVSVRMPFILEITALPPVSSFRHRIADWDCVYSRSADELAYEAKLRIKALRVEAEEYGALQELRRKLYAESRSLPVAQRDFRSLDVDKMIRTFPGADSVILADSVRTEILAPGKMQTCRRIRNCILTKNGVRTQSEMHIPYRPETTQITVEGQVTDRDGHVHPITADAIHEIDDPAFSGAPRYAPGRMMIVNIPSVKIGSVIDLSLTVVRKNLPFCYDRCVFGKSPTIRADYTLLYDPDMRVRFAPVSRNFSETESRDRHVRTRTWTAQNLSGFRAEKQQAAPFLFADAITFSTGKAEKYGAELEKKLQHAVSQSGERVAAVTRKLALENEDAVPDKLLRIRDWVDRNIRPAGPDLSKLLPGEFFSPETTIADGYGNSADRAILVAALCRAAKIEYDFLFVSPHLAADRMTRFLARYPGLDYHSVVVCHRETGIILNDTGIYAALGATSSEGHVALDRQGKIQSVYPQIGMDSGVRTRYRIMLRADGGARIFVTKHVFGNFYEKEKKRFTELTPEFFRRHFEAVAAKFSPKATVFDKPQIAFDRHPGCVSYIVDVPDFAVPVGKYLSFDLPGYTDMLRFVNIGDDRKTPYVNRIDDLRLEYEIILPENYEPTTRPDGRRELSAPGTIIYVGQSRYFGRTISINHQMLLFSAILAGADAAATNDIYKQLKRLHEWRIVLEKIRNREGDPQ